MNSSFKQGENVAFSANGDDKRNPNARGQRTNKCQSPNDKSMTRFKTQMIHPVVIARSPSAEGRRSNLAEELQSVEIAAHLSGARNDPLPSVVARHGSAEAI